MMVDVMLSTASKLLICNAHLLRPSVKERLDALVQLRG